MWKQINSFGDAFAARGGDVAAVAPVVFHGRSQVPRVCSFAVPRSTGVRAVVKDSLATRGCEGGAVEVKRTVDVMVG